MGIFALYGERSCKRDALAADAEDLQENHASEVNVERINAKDITNPGGYGTRSDPGTSPVPGPVVEPHHTPRTGTDLGTSQELNTAPI